MATYTFTMNDTFYTVIAAEKNVRSLQLAFSKLQGITNHAQVITDHGEFSRSTISYGRTEGIHQPRNPEEFERRRHNFFATTPVVIGARDIVKIIARADAIFDDHVAIIDERTSL